MEVVFGAIGLAMLVGYGTLLWEGMAPESALGFIAAGGLVVGLLIRIAIGVLTSPDAPAPVTVQAVRPPDGSPRTNFAPSPDRAPRSSSGEDA